MDVAGSSINISQRRVYLNRPILPTLRLLESGLGEVAPHEFHHLGYCSEILCLLLREDNMAVHGHIEDATVALDQLGLQIKLVLQGGCQPGSPRIVVSRNAIGDRKPHLSIPPDVT